MLRNNPPPSGTVNYSVAANTGPARSGTMTIAGQTFTVTQDSGCTLSISPTSQNFAASGGTGSVSVTAGAGCSWTAASNAAFITITSSSAGSGNGTVSYSVAANTGASRSGTITIAGQTFTVTQAGAPAGRNCTRTQGFWKTHPNDWLVSSLTLGTQNYTRSELLTILNTSDGGDASLILAKQLIAAKLNIASGADASAIAATVQAADDWLSQYTGKLPYKVASASQQGQIAVNLANRLDQYNNGTLPGGPPHCDPVAQAQVFVNIFDPVEGGRVRSWTV